jgi:hypothetical protein
MDLHLDLAGEHGATIELVEDVDELAEEVADERTRRSVSTVRRPRLRA